MKGRLVIGEPVIYRALKRSPHPGPRAADISSETRGEDYVYHVDKYWVVADMPDEGDLLLRTRKGKEHLVRTNDPNLRHLH